jgi:hypothetical protein
MEMWLRLTSVGDVVRVDGPVAAFYRVSAQSMSTVAKVNLTSGLEFCRDAFTVWHAFADGRVSDRDALLAAAKNALARRAVRRAKVAFLENPLGGEFDELCKFALDVDPSWATPEVDRLRTMRDRTWTRQLLRVARPATKSALWAYRTMDDIRYRLRAR